jgi:hypothetical protein
MFFAQLGILIVLGWYPHRDMMISSKIDVDNRPTSGLQFGVSDEAITYLLVAEVWPEHIRQR